MSDIKIGEGGLVDNETQVGSSPELLTLLGSLVKNRRWIYLLVGATVLSTIIICLFLPNRYTAKALILPSGGTLDRFGGLEDLAGLVGDLPFGSADMYLENSSFLYPDILRSRLIREEVIAKVYQYPKGSKRKSQNLFDYFKVKKKDGAIKALARITNIELDRKTGIITISATTKNRHLSAAVANEYINQLENYNLDTRRSKAKENEKFISQRLEEVKLELKQAEDSLEAFQLRNRNFNTSTSPELATQLARLVREVEIKSKVFLTLTQEYELARVETKNDVPVVQVLDYAKPPDEKAGPNRKLIVLTAFLLSGFLGMVIVLSVELSRARIKPEEYQHVLQLGGEFKTDLVKVYSQAKRPFSRLRTTKNRTPVSPGGEN